MLCSTIKKINNSKHKIAIYLILIVFLAAGLRTIRAFEQSRYDKDAYVYLVMAQDWNIGGAGYSFSNNGFLWMPPLLPYLMSRGELIGLSPETTGLLAGGILGSLIPIAIFIIILNIINVLKCRNLNFHNCSDAIDEDGLLVPQKKLHTTNNFQPATFNFSNEFLALLGAFLSAIHPYMIRISVSCMRESIYIPILIFSVIVGIVAIKRNSIWLWGIFGILAAFGFMTRKEGLEILIILIVYGFIDVIINYKKVFKRKLIYWISAILIAIVCFLGVVLPVQQRLSNTSVTWSIMDVINRGVNSVWN